MEIAAIALLGVASYLIGSITPAYYLVSFLKKSDIRTVGSRNVGTLNTYHQLGAEWAALVLLFDVGKGVIAVLLPGWIGLPDWAVFVTGALVIAGHNWPVVLRFKGGKGAATLIGLLLGIVPVATLMAAVPGILALLLARNGIVGLTVGFITVNVLVIVAWIFGFAWLVPSPGLLPFLFSLLLTLLVTVVYGVSIRGQLMEAVRQRSLRQAFYGS